MEIANIEDAMQSHFERLALLSYIYSPYQFLLCYFLFPKPSFLRPSFFPNSSVRRRRLGKW